MRSDVISLEGMLVVAYADALLPEQTPSVVPPVFKAPYGDLLLFPPFQIRGLHVHGAAVGTMADLNRLIERGDATRLEQPFEARPDHDLWIDEKMVPHYEEWDLVEKKHQRMALDWSMEADAALMKDDLEKADLLSGRAMNAHAGVLDPYVIQAVIKKCQGEDDPCLVFRHMAASIVSPSNFDQLVEAKWRKLHESRSGSREVAAKKIPYAAVITMHLRKTPMAQSKPARSFAGVSDGVLCHV